MSKVGLEERIKKQLSTIEIKTFHDATTLNTVLQQSLKRSGWSYYTYFAMKLSFSLSRNSLLQFYARSNLLH